MYRNYQRGRHETLNVDLSDVGSDKFMVRADGLEGNAFYDMAIYSDSGRTTPLSVSDWEYYTEDERKTEQEALTGGTGETVYSQIKILNPTYQSGNIYLTFESFGTYPDGNVHGIDYIEPGDADYSFTTQRNLMTYIVFDGITADRTMTVTDAGFDERSRFKVINKNTTYKVIVEDGTESEPYWVNASQSVDFYDVDDTISWCSGSSETVWSGSSTSVAPTSLSRGVIENHRYRVTMVNGSVTWSGELDLRDINTATEDARTETLGTPGYVHWDGSSNVFSTVSFTADFEKIEILREQQ